MSNQLLERRRMMLSVNNIPWDDILIQTLDSTKDGYNPAAAIILSNNNKGITLSNPIIPGGGRYYLTKSDAALITSIGTWFKGVNSVVDTNAIVTSDNTIEYNFNSFNELEELGLTSFGNSKYEFGGCLKLNYLTIPFPIRNISYFPVGSYNASNNLGYVGESYNIGKIIFKGDISISYRRSYIRFKEAVFYGDVTGANNYYSFESSPTIVRIKGNVTNQVVGKISHNVIQMVDLYDSYTGNMTFLANYWRNQTLPKVHLNKPGTVAGPVTYFFSTNNSNVTATKIYVGDGSSYQNDLETFDLYAADSGWATHCGGVPGAGRVDLWWNYNGEYRTYLVQENLTNCTTSNPIEWPYITRNESYSTTITANEGYVLSSVQVQMYEAVDDGATPSTPTDITSTAYNPMTREINIEHVTGNVIITATTVAYTRVEYLESTGTQYIDTGLTSLLSDVINIDFTPLSTYTVSQGIFGSQDVGVARCFVFTYSHGVQVCKPWGGASGYTSAGTFVVGVRTNLTVDVPSRQAQLDGLTPIDIGVPSGTSLSTYLFCFNRNDSPYLRTSMRLYHYSVSGRINLIPVRCGTVGYMYDRVSGQLFGNAGTGDFVLGPDVN